MKSRVDLYTALLELCSSTQDCINLIRAVIQDPFTDQYEKIRTIREICEREKTVPYN